MSIIDQTIPVPERGLLGLKALADIGESRIDQLALVLSDRPLTLSFSALIDELSSSLECEANCLLRGFLDCLIPLNGLRRTLGIPPAQFLERLANTIRRSQSPLEPSEAEKCIQLLPHLAPFFAPDNFFSQAGRAFELLSLHPAIFLKGRVLNELRPIYNEDTTKTLSVIHTNTLLLSYWSDDTERTLHVTLDADDLQSLHSELERAMHKLAVSQKEASEQGANLLVVRNERGQSK